MITSVDAGLPRWLYWLKKKKKNLPANAGDIRDVGLIPRLGKFLERGMTAPSSIFTWEIPCTKEPGGL